MNIDQFLINPHRARIVQQLFEEHERMRDHLERAPNGSNDPKQ
jgi:hypothetical protein